MFKILDSDSDAMKIGSISLTQEIAWDSYCMLSFYNKKTQEMCFFLFFLFFFCLLSLFPFVFLLSKSCLDCIMSVVFFWSFQFQSLFIFFCQFLAKKGKKNVS